MTPIAAFLVGLLIGWLAEWIIDWIYWRRKNEIEQPARVVTDIRRLALLEQEIASYKDQLANLQLDVARSADVPLTRDTDLLSDEIVRMIGQAPVRDRLEGIQGLNLELVHHLNAAGIYTFVDLGALRPAALKDILGEQVPLPAEIIKQARIKGGMIKSIDDLETIDGIGPLMARILNNAGIFTFSELSSLTIEELREIMGDRFQRLADEEEILSQARQLAEEQNQGG